jgi:hypothetical protein
VQGQQRIMSLGHGQGQGGFLPPCYPSSEVSGTPLMARDYTVALAGDCISRPAVGRVPATLPAAAAAPATASVADTALVAVPAAFSSSSGSSSAPSPHVLEPDLQAACRASLAHLTGLLADGREGTQGRVLGAEFRFFWEGQGSIQQMVLWQDGSSPKARQYNHN